jgi:hypothetical protein
VCHSRIPDPLLSSTLLDRLNDVFDLGFEGMDLPSVWIWD